MGSTKDVTIAVWVGYPNGVKPMETEYGGNPVDGGTIPALIFNDVLTAYDQLTIDRKNGIDPSTGEATIPPTSPTTPTTTTTESTDQAPSGATQDSGGGSSGGSSATSTGGGISPG